MKKAIKNYLAKLQENEKKGFSLVELIIVMAIMAILVGIVASQVLPYMEKSRQSKDQQIVSNACTDMVSAIAQAKGQVPTTTFNLPSGGTMTDTGMTDANAKDAVVQFNTLHDGKGFDFKSKAAKGAGNIVLVYNATTGKITGYPDSCNLSSSGDALTDDDGKDCSKLLVITD